MWECIGSTQGGNVTSAGWQVTLCDPMWHMSSRSGVATLRTAIHLLLVTYARTGSSAISLDPVHVGLHWIHTRTGSSVISLDPVHVGLHWIHTRSRSSLISLNPVHVGLHALFVVRLHPVLSRHNDHRKSRGTI